MKRPLAALALLLATQAQAGAFTYSLRQGHLPELLSGATPPGPTARAEANHPFDVPIARPDLPLRYLTAFTPHDPSGRIQYLPAELVGGPAIPLCLPLPAVRPHASQQYTLLIQQSDPASGTPGCGPFERRRELAPGQWLTIATESDLEAHDPQRGPYVVQIRISVP